MKVPFAVAFVLSGLDLATTVYGLSVGFTESRVAFMPFLSAFIICAVFLTANKLRVPKLIRLGVYAGLLAVLAYPAVANLSLIVSAR